MVRSSALWVFLACLVCALGCGGNDGSAPTGEVKGVLTYQGKPVPNVNVTFTPTQGRPGTGTTNANGEFSITTFTPDDGAVPGSHKVTVTSSEVAPMPGTPEAEKAANAPPPFPPKYSDPAQTDLTATIEQGKVNEVKLDMKD